jgi:hypothetical protein
MLFTKSSLTRNSRSNPNCNFINYIAAGSRNIQRWFMPRIIRTKQSGQALGAILCLLGFIALLVVFWKAWPGASSSQNVLSALWVQILSQQISIGSIVTLELAYVTAAGTVSVIVGLLVFALSRQIFHVSREPTLLQCPYCRNQWKARRAMGWAECPFCRKFINPQTVKKV